MKSNHTSAEKIFYQVVEKDGSLSSTWVDPGSAYRGLAGEPGRVLFRYSSTRPAERWYQHLREWHRVDEGSLPPSVPPAALFDLSSFPDPPTEGWDDEGACFYILEPDGAVVARTLEWSLAWSYYRGGNLVRELFLRPGHGKPIRKWDPRAEQWKPASRVPVAIPPAGIHLYTYAHLKEEVDE